MSTQTFGLIELFLVFGGVLALALQQLLSLRRLKRRREEAEREAHDADRKGRRGIL